MDRAGVVREESGEVDVPFLRMKDLTQLRTVFRKNARFDGPQLKGDRQTESGARTKGKNSERERLRSVLPRPRLKYEQHT
jgi:hypothetical protein